MAIAIQGSPGNAAPAVPLTTRDVDGSASNFIYVQGILTPSGSYTITTGDLVDWTAIADKIASGTLIAATAWSQNGTGNAYIFTQNALLNSWRLRVYQAAGGVELPTGAYPGAITSDVIAFQAIFRKLL